MFAHHDAHAVGPLGLNSLKRGRDDEVADISAGGILSFTEHRNKRLQTLPLRGPPGSGNWSQSSTSPECLPLRMPHTITPSDSDSEDVAAQFGRYSQQQEYTQQPRSHGSAWLSSSAGDIGQQGPTSQPGSQDNVFSDNDMDMMMDSVETMPGNSSGGALEPGSFHPDSVGTCITGRMPTPILPSFAAQVRGNNWGGAAGNVMQNVLNPGQCQNVSDAEGFTASPGGAHAVSSPIGDRTVPRSLEHPGAIMAEWGMVQNRPLPSPISESGGEEMSSPDMVLDCAPTMPGLPHRAASAMEMPMYLRDSSPFPDQSFSADTATLPSSPPQEHPNLQQYAQYQQQRQASPSSSSSSPSPKKGHTRSRHTVNNWTLNPGMKKSFSIGYRADCEKCRLKVPGHFNHIIIS